MCEKSEVNNTAKHTFPSPVFQQLILFGVLKNSFFISLSFATRYSTANFSVYLIKYNLEGFFVLVCILHANFFTC